MNYYIIINEDGTSRYTNSGQLTKEEFRDLLAVCQDGYISILDITDHNAPTEYNGSEWTEVEPFTPWDQD